MRQPKVTEPSDEDYDPRPRRERYEEGPRDDPADERSMQPRRGGLLERFFGGPFGNPFRDIWRMYDDVQASTHSMFTDFDRHFDEPNPGKGEYYVSSTSTTILPSGVCETKSRVRHNNVTTEEHVRSIGDRRVVQRRERDLVSGREDVRRDLHALEERDVDGFMQDFDSRLAGARLPGLDRRLRGDDRRDRSLR